MACILLEHEEINDIAQTLPPSPLSESQNPAFDLRLKLSLFRWSHVLRSYRPLTFDAVQRLANTMRLGPISPGI